MKFIFRVDSGIHIGNGHLSRCEAMAEYFLEKGHSVLFCYRDHYLHKNPKFESVCIGKGIHTEETLPVEEWLGVSQEQDAEDFLKKAVVQKNSEAILIVDHYSLDQDFEKKCKPFFKKILVIDDLGQRKHVSDILLNYGPGFKPSMFNKKVSNTCELLLGLDYVILRKSLIEAREFIKPLSGSIQNILVSLGTVTEEIVLSLIDGLSELKKNVTIITSPNLAQKLNSQQNKHIQIIAHVSDLEKYYLNFDFCIGAAGVSMWERAFLGVPSSVFLTADNQKFNIEQAQKLQIADIKNNFELRNSKEWKKYFLSLGTMDLSKRQQMRDAGLSLIDGKGLSRIAEKLL